MFVYSTRTVCKLETLGGRDSSFAKDRFVDRDPFVVARVPVGDIQLLVGGPCRWPKRCKAAVEHVQSFHMLNMPFTEVFCCLTQLA